MTTTGNEKPALGNIPHLTRSFQFACTYSFTTGFLMTDANIEATTTALSVDYTVSHV